MSGGSPSTTCIEENTFGLLNGKEGPYRLQLSTQDGRLMFEIFNEQEEKLSIIGLSMSPFRVIVKDYFQICESYYQAIRHSDALADRNHRHGAARAAQRGQRNSQGKAQRQGRHRFRYGAAAVYAGLCPALARIGFADAG